MLIVFLRLHVLCIRWHDAMGLKYACITCCLADVCIHKFVSLMRYLKLQEVRSLHGLASAILNRVSDGAASTSTDGTVISSFTTGSGDLEQQQPSPAVSD